jgi:hypothetical protein
MNGLPITLEMTPEEEEELERMIATSALNRQVGGSHYRDKGIQPIIYIHANELGFCEGNVVKYVTRWRDKNGIADLRKAIHYLELLIELEDKNLG